MGNQQKGMSMSMRTRRRLKLVDIASCLKVSIISESFLFRSNYVVQFFLLFMLDRVMFDICLKSF